MDVVKHRAVVFSEVMKKYMGPYKRGKMVEMKMHLQISSAMKQ